MFMYPGRLSFADLKPYFKNKNLKLFHKMIQISVFILKNKLPILFSVISRHFNQIIIQTIKPIAIILNYECIERLY